MEKSITVQFLDTIEEDQCTKLYKFFEENDTPDDECVDITFKFDTLTWKWMDIAEKKGEIDEEIKEGFNNEFNEFMAGLNK